jgi:hypothetical protein
MFLLLIPALFCTNLKLQYLSLSLSLYIYIYIYIYIYKQYEVNFTILRYLLKMCGCSFICIAQVHVSFTSQNGDVTFKNIFPLFHVTEYLERYKIF